MRQKRLPGASSLVAIMGLALIVVASSCAPAAAPTPLRSQSTTTTMNTNSPEGVVRRAYAAVERNDTATFADLIVPFEDDSNPYRGTLLGPKVPFVFLQGLKGLNTTLKDVTFRDLSFTIMSGEDDWAMVQVKGYAHLPHGQNDVPIDAIEHVRRWTGRNPVGIVNTPRWFLSNPSRGSHAMQDPALKISLLEVSRDASSPAKAGWTNYQARFSVINQSTRYVPLYLRDTALTVTTTQGTSYKGESSYGFVSSHQVTVPPGARITRTYEYYFERIFQVPSTLHVDKINLGEQGVYDVRALYRLTGAFPTGEPSDVRQLPATIELPGLAAITIDRSTKGSAVSLSLKITSKVATGDISIPLKSGILLDSGAYIPVRDYDPNPRDHAYDSGFVTFSIGPLQSDTFQLRLPPFDNKEPKRWLILDGQIVGTFRF